MAAGHAFNRSGAVNKGVHHLRVKLGAALGTDLFHRLRMRHTGLVDLVAHHGVVNVGYGHDARAQGDGLTNQLLRVAVAVPVLVV